MTPQPQSQPTPDPLPRATFGDAAEAAEFVAMLEKFERGEINSEQYRQYRLSRGIYGQRQEGVQMVRVKIPQGILSAGQLRTLADCADRWSRGYGHVTTRQNLQFHFVKPENVGPFMEAVALSGLTTREACSHTVRNVAGCPYAGVCGGEPFDVTPYGEAITRHFLRAPLGSGLPRKFKIAISGCDDDCAQGAMNDIGIVAQVRDGRRGFRVLCGGGTSTLPRSGAVLHEFLPEEQLLASCEAVVRVFNREGERANLQKARLKWAIKRLGWEAFQALHRTELERILSEGGRPLPPLAVEAPLTRRVRAVPTRKPLPSRFGAWEKTNVRTQAQAGFTATTARLRLGDISSRQLRGVATLCEQLGDGTVRTTNSQNLLFRWIASEALASLWLGLDELGLGDPGADGVSDVVSCPGAETCRIAVTASRGMAQALTQHLDGGGRPGAEVSGLDIKISGCPNGCGQNHVAAIGLQGGTKRLGDRLVPHYHLTLGGGIDRHGAAFGRLVGKIPARRVTRAVDRLVADYEEHRGPGQTARSYFQSLEISQARALLADLFELKPSEAGPDDFRDLGSQVDFKVIDLDGECAQ